MKMTRKRLKRYRILRRQILRLEERILEADSRGRFVMDTVTSASEFPYDKREIPIKGYTTTDHANRLRSRLAAVEAEVAAIERFIESIEDSTMYLIISLLYRDGMTVEDAAEWLGLSGATVYRHLKDFFVPNGDDSL